jgi:hypothetical protein
MSQKKLKLEDLDEEEMSIYIDRNRFEQCFFELIGYCARKIKRRN